MVLTGLEYVFLALLTTGTGLFSAYIVYLVIRKNLKSTINGYIPVVGGAVRKQLTEFMAETTEGLDLGAIAGQLGGNEGGSGGLTDIAGMLGGDSGGLGEIIKLLSTFSGKKGSSKGGKMGL